MYRKKPDVDVIMDILDAALVAYPESTFIKSLWTQYQERGGLSKKQLEGLYGKASKVSSIPHQKLATLEAEIRKRPNRYKSEAPPPTPLYAKDESIGEKISFILAINPDHKRVLFFKSKYDNNETLTASEISELKKFHSLFSKGK